MRTGELCTGVVIAFALPRRSPVLPPVDAEGGVAAIIASIRLVNAFRLVSRVLATGRGGRGAMVWLPGAEMIPEAERCVYQRERGRL